MWNGKAGGRRRLFDQLKNFSLLSYCGYFALTLMIYDISFRYVNNIRLLNKLLKALFSIVIIFYDAIHKIMQGDDKKKDENRFVH